MTYRDAEATSAQEQGSSAPLWLSQLVEVVDLIPGPIWLLIGSGLSIIGIMLTNRANDRRLRRQFEYERELRNADSDLALRKEIYLNAVETLWSGLEAITKLADIEAKPVDVIKMYAKRSSDVSKVNVVADIETLESVYSISARVENKITALSFERMMLDLQRQEIEKFDRNFEQFSKGLGRDIERLQESMQKADDERELRQDIMKRMLSDHNVFIEGMNKFMGDMGNQLQQYMDFMIKCHQERNDLLRQMVPVIVAVRSELGLPIDEKLYKAAVEKALAASAPEFDKHSSNAKEAIETAFRMFTDGISKKQ